METTTTNNKKRKEMENGKKENKLPVQFFSYLSKFFDNKNNENEKIFKEIFENAKWLQEKAIFGNIPTRKACVYGNPNVSYTYSKNTKPTNDWKLFPLLLNIKERIEKETKENYDYVLLNYYPDGNSSIGMHADDEESVSQKHSIVSISFGESRVFCLKHNTSGELFKVSLNDGDMFIMKPGTQQEWKHGINKEPKKTKSRISLTF